MDGLRVSGPFAVLDLGTGYAKALLVHRGPAGSWGVVGAAIVSYRRQRGASGRYTVAQLEAAEEALRRAHHRAMRLAGRTAWPTTCLISIASPPAHTTLLGQDSQRGDSAQAIGTREARELTYAAETAAVAAASREVAQQRSDSAPVWLGPFWRASAIEGRPVTALSGFRGSSVQLEVGVASAGSEVRTLRNWCEDRGMRPVLLPEPLWQEGLLSRRPGCLVLDVGASRVGISYRGPSGSLCRLGARIGGHHFTRYLSLAAHISPERAERLKLAYSGGRLKDPTRGRIHLVMERALVSWSRRFKESLSTAAGVLPGLWLVCGGGSSLPELALLPALVAGDSISQLERYPVWQPLAPADVCRHVAPGPERLGPSHLVALALADWWLQLFQESSLRRQVGRLAEAARQAGYEVDADWLKL